jgi:polyhydroxyalkanoate synthesis regulator phasin
MNDFAKKLVLLGMGLASFTEEKSKQIISELLERGEKYNESDSKLAEFLKAADKSTQDFENKIENVLKDLISKLNLATKDDIEALKKEVEELKSRG